MSAAVQEDQDGRIAAVEAAYPGWHVYVNDAGRWVAVRTGARAAWGKAGAAWDRKIPMTTDAPSEEALRAELDEYLD